MINNDIFTDFSIIFISFEIHFLEFSSEYMQIQTNIHNFLIIRLLIIILKLFRTHYIFVYLIQE